MQRRKNITQKSLFFLLLSVVVHAGFLAALLRPKREQAKPAASQQFIKLALLEKRPAKPVLPPAVASSQPPAKSRPPTPKQVLPKRPEGAAALKSRQQTELPKPAAVGQRLATYQGLLGLSADKGVSLPTSPKRGGQGAGARLSERLGGEKAQEADLVMGEFSFALVIPYAYRSLKDDGNASARLALQPRSGGKPGLYLELLSGDPYLRAVLWKALGISANQKLLGELLTLLKESSLTVDLVFTVRHYPPRRHGLHETHWRLEGQTLTINQDFYPPSPSEGATIQLKDDIVERDNERDRVKLRALRESPAYQHNMRGCWL